MRYLLAVSWMLACPLTSAVAQVSVQIGVPNVSIGINLPVYPRLVRVSGYPVYYAPNVDSNYFFYDGMYWVYQGDTWYASSWYNGPWALVSPEAVPVYVLRVPVRYYRRPPAYFHGWRRDAPPRWGEHWGNDWEHQRSGWDKWNRKAAPPPAPLPLYQRQYSRDRYPEAERQPTLHDQHYRYQPRDATVQQAYRAQGLHGAPPPPQRGSTQQHEAQRPNPPSPHAQPGMTTPHQQSARAPEHDKGHSGQPKGEGQGQEHNR